MRFYHCFYTDLPDQFVEANHERLIKWINGWDDKNRYYHRHATIDVVGLSVIGNAKKDKYPTITTNSMALINNWLNSKGHLYNGRYWESLTEDQRSPVRITSGGTRGTLAHHASSIAQTSRISHFASIRANIPPATWCSLNQAQWQLINAGPPFIMSDELIPKPPLRRESITAGEIIGYRCWRIENGLLRSVYQKDIWYPNQPLEGRELGDWDSRGIHAWKDSGSKEYHYYIRRYLNIDKDDFITNAITWLSDANDKEYLHPAMITGSVFLWGDVVEHERGYRAEYAKVRSLDWLYLNADMMGREQEVLDELRQKYGVRK